MALWRQCLSVQSPLHHSGPSPLPHQRPLGFLSLKSSRMSTQVSIQRRQTCHLPILHPLRLSFLNPVLEASHTQILLTGTTRMHHSQYLYQKFLDSHHLRIPLSKPTEFLTRSLMGRIAKSASHPLPRRNLSQPILLPLLQNLLDYLSAVCHPRQPHLLILLVLPRNPRGRSIEPWKRFWKKTLLHLSRFPVLRYFRYQVGIETVSSRNCLCGPILARHLELGDLIRNTVENEKFQRLGCA